MTKIRRRRSNRHICGVHTPKLSGITLSSARPSRTTKTAITGAPLNCGTDRKDGCVGGAVTNGANDCAPPRSTGPVGPSRKQATSCGSNLVTACSDDDRSDRVAFIDRHVQNRSQPMRQRTQTTFWSSNRRPVRPSSSYHADDEAYRRSCSAPISLTRPNEPGG